MGKPTAEVDFPRGAIPKTGTNKAQKTKKASVPAFLRNIFEEKNDKETKVNGTKKSGKKKNKLTSDEMQLLSGSTRDVFAGEILTFDNICEDFLSLGRISKVLEGRVTVALPCRVVGEVDLLNVSRPYTKILKAVESGSDVDDTWYTLGEMFTVGQLVSVRVKKIEDMNFRKKIILSTDPAELHKNYGSSNIVKGMIFTAAVESVEDHGYIMDLGIEDTRCFLPSDKATKFIKSVNQGRPLGIGQIVTCQVTAVKESGNLSNVTLSADPSPIHKFKYPDDMCLNYSLLLPGMMLDALVTEVATGGLKVHVMDLEGFIHKDHLRETWADPGSVELGSSVPARVLYLFPNGTNPYLSLQPKLFPHNCLSEESKIPFGSNQTVTIARIERFGVVIRFANGEKGIVSIRRCSDDATCTMEQIREKFPKGSSHECKVLYFSNMDYIYIATFEKSLIDEKVVCFEQVEPGLVVKCLVLHWKPTGAVVIFGKVRGFIPTYHVGNVPIRNPVSKYPPGSAITAKVMRVHPAKKHVLLTAKKELVRVQVPILKSYADCAVGIVSKGTVKGANKGGVILETIGCLTVFVPTPTLGIERDVNILGLFFIGRVVTFQITKCDPERKYCTGTLIITENASADEANSEGAEKIDSVAKVKKRKAEENCENDKKEKNKKKKKKSTVSNPEEISQVTPSSDEMEVETSQSLEPEESTEEVSTKKDMNDVVDDHGLRIGASSFWGVDSVEGDPRGPELDRNEEPSVSGEQKKLTKKEKRKLKEQQIREAEKAMADSNSNLNSEDDFERLMMASPNSSMCWIKYMAFFLNNGEILKAKEVGRRALKTILYREEQERFNVWVALLNLENTHGTEESMDAILQEAVRSNDEYRILSTVTEIFTQSNKISEAENIFKRMLKKFRDQINPYVKYGKFLYQHKRTEDARDLLKKALLNLNRNLHVQLISKFCQIELELGERERGLTMFDQLLGTYPKRVDVWLVYANALVKIGDFEGAKNVLVRAVDIGLPPKKSKPLFTRLYEVDKMCPNSDPEAIRQLALEYAKNISSATF